MRTEYTGATCHLQHVKPISYTFHPERDAPLNKFAHAKLSNFPIQLSMEEWLFFVFVTRMIS